MARSKAGNGSRTVLFTCSYVPEEIITAAGFVPRRVLPDAAPSDADGYVHPNTCGLLKSLLATGLAAKPGEAAGIVFANSCDGARRLYERHGYRWKAERKIVKDEWENPGRNWVLLVK